MTPEEISARVEGLSEELVLLRREQSAGKRDLGRWVFSVALGHLLFSLAVWLGILGANPHADVKVLLIFMMSAIQALFTGLSVLVSARGWLSVRRLFRHQAGDASAL